jgi:hypothetical protein
MKILKRGAKFEDGKLVGYEGLEVLAANRNLPSLINWHKDIPDEIRPRLASQAVDTAISLQRYNIDAVSEEVKRVENDYLNQEPVTFSLLTSLSIMYFPELEDIHVEDAHVTFFENPPNGFSQQHTNFADLLYPAQLPTRYTWVVVTVKARCPYSAYTQAAFALDLLRGLWNYALDRRRQRFSNLRPKPLNSIVLGPIHTMHHQDGTPALDVYWYEPSYIEESSLCDFKRNYNGVKRIEKLYLSKLQRCTYGQEIRDTIVQYARSLDLSDLHASLIQLWTVLERVTGTLPGDTYDVTIHRALFLFNDKDFHGMALERLRHERNNFVHANQQVSHIEESLCELRQYVCACLNFAITYSANFTSFAHYSQFLDLPFSLEEVVKRKKRVQEDMDLLNLYEYLASL